MKARIPTEERVRWSVCEGALAAADLCWLIALHETFHFGAGRLTRAMKRAQDIYTEYRNRYALDSDIGNLNVNSAHLIAMKDELKSIGFYYDVLIRQAEQSQKNRWHGNHFIDGGKK